MRTRNSTAERLDCAALTEEALETSLVRRFGRTPEVLALIATAMLSFRRGREATERLDVEGLTIQPGRGIFRHPLVQVERAAKRDFINALQALEHETRRRKHGGPTRVEQLPQKQPISARAQRYLRGWGPEK